MKPINYFISVLIIFLYSSILHAQPWTKNVRDGERNFYTIQKEFNKLYDGKIPAKLEEGEEIGRAHV